MAKLGKDTGSLVNYISMNSANAVQPEIGMGVTTFGWTDRYPGTIQSIETIRGKVYIGITGDDAQRVDTNGFSEMQEYVYTQRPDAPQSYYRFNEARQQWEGVRKNPETGRWVLNNNNGIRIGEREKYYDHSF